jgi:hypothetical protein
MIYKIYIYKILYAAIGTKIATYGDNLITLNLRLRRSFPWRFIIANVENPIIGMNFLAHYNLLVDARNKTLINGTTKLICQGQLARKSTTSVAKTIAGDSSYNKLLANFPNLKRPPVFRWSYVKRSTQHYIDTTPGPSIHSKARRLAPDRLKIAKEEIELMFRQGIIQLSKSPWSSPIHLAPNKDGKIRLCGDYRALNNRMKPDRYAPRLLEDFMQNLQGPKIFSNIDLIRAYKQIPGAPESIEKTAIITIQTF